MIKQHAYDWLGVLLLSGVIMVIGACSSSVKRPDTQPPQDPTNMGKPQVTPKIPDQEVVVPQRKVFISKPVVQNLIKKAKLRSDALDYEAAIYLLERGVAISPNDPLLWQRMAEVRLKQGKLQQAQQLAMKSNVLAESDEKMRSVNWQIINESKRRETLQNLGGSVLH